MPLMMPWACMATGISSILSTFKLESLFESDAKLQPSFQHLTTLNLEEDQKCLYKLREQLTDWENELLDEGGLYEKQSLQEKQLDQFIQKSLRSLSHKQQPSDSNAITFLRRSLGSDHETCKRFALHSHIIKQLKRSNDILHLRQFCVRDAFHFVSLLHNAVDKLVITTCHVSNLC